MIGATIEPIGAAPPSGASRRVLVTRPPAQARAWVEALRARGVDAAALPLIDTAAAADPAPVDAAWSELARWAALVFVSPNAVTQFFARRPAGAAWPDQLIAAAPGPGTAAELRTHGIRPRSLIEPAAGAARFDSETLWEQMQRHDWRGRRVLIVRGESGRDWLAGRLAAAGATVDLLAAYRRGPAALDAARRALALAALAYPARHLWFFSSSESVQQLTASELLDAPALCAALRRSVALATHPRIAQTARAAGFGRVLEARPELNDVVRCIQSAPAPDFSG